mmetsp:Transcript_96967/g.172599  ORF Transcript_96967/g.172599 Transcript_96967/m.172599 type:complete len:93 (-) Transcript_96967:34-312(-)|eukprot:CAMPEP_0197644696 /NCGR_PEP_ID=MMETSP1338-20131121/17588_1 /TAXON_ID=43686 ORGANISM="Pelagodinium beii, Strain RCC1491" /NCGR_SAMPLE_ID=MMETSP1338 /ASSEMBLY_ACC=CAM_ASM_000754 /LENGTH=92 /DNA_ID=CAMNT_0043218133 /DNA_START=126 /DNA_END=404 /DNA_ORIENTATION=+
MEEAFGAEMYFNKGLMHETGEGAQKDVEEALKCFQAAARAGHAKARMHLSKLDTMQLNSLLPKSAKLKFITADETDPVRLYFVPKHSACKKA